MPEFSKFNASKLGSIVLILLLLLLAMTGCNDDDKKVEDSSSSGNETSETFTVGLLLSDLSNPFFVSVQEGAQSAATRLGITLVVEDAKNDVTIQITQVQTLIAQSVNALLINPVDGDGIVPAIEAANAAGIPVFTIDRSASGGVVVSHIASDNVAGGAMAGEYLCTALGGEGKVVELEGIAGTSAARDRGQGFNDYLTANCPGIEVVARQTANFNRDEGLTVFENILQSEDTINGVFAHNDEMILGAIEAAVAAGRDADITFVGFDAIDDAVAAVQDGSLAATVAQQPAVIGQLGVETAAAYLAGQTVESYIPVPLSLVTAGE